MTETRGAPYARRMQPPIVITGGTSGIGHAIQSRLASHGHTTINLDLIAPETETTHLPCDLSDRDSIEAAAAALPDQIGGLICVAGVGPLPNEPEKVMRINFLGTRWLVETLLPRIEHQGAITLVASSAGRDWRDNTADVQSMLATTDFEAGIDWLSKHGHAWRDNPYKFSKQCLAAYTYHAVGLAKPRNVRVNCINPGITQTNLSESFRDLLGRETYDHIVSLTGRAGRPSDIAGLAEFLTVGDAEWINGVEITVDGGYYAGVVAGRH